MQFPEGTRIHFVSDVHLGLMQGDPAEREERFVRYLKSLEARPSDVLCMLGDIWDFWYEYRDVIPREGFRVLAALQNLLDAGMRILFVPGNHDIWCYSFFESIGIRKLPQGEVLEVGDTRILVAHGDLLGGAPLAYRFMIGVFHNRLAQRAFSLLHPTLAFRFGTNWSRGSRKAHKPYTWKADSREPLYRYCLSRLDSADIFIFGHYHVPVDQALPQGKRLVVLADWISPGGPQTPSVSYCCGDLTVSE